MSQYSKWELLDIAKKRIDKKWSLQDSGSILSLHNIQTGLAKIISVLKTLGYPLDVGFVASPDLSPPKGHSKWKWGLSAGGVLSWGKGDRPIIFLDPRVSIGGTLAGGLHTLSGMDEIMENITWAKSNPPTVMGIKTQWDYNKGNHFINLYETTGQENLALPPYIFILHGSAKEVTVPSALGPGLDYQKNTNIQKRMKLVETPLGVCRVLLDDDAEIYYQRYRHLETFALEKHLAFSRLIFKDFEFICNRVHHGFLNANAVILGCYCIPLNDPGVYPVTLRPDLPSYLVSGIFNRCIQEDCLADTEPVSMTQHTVIPHGGGVTFPHIKGIMRDSRLQGGDHLELVAVNGSRIMVETLESLEACYRGMEVVDVLKRNYSIQIVAKLKPLSTLML